jgi:hypothetical protein
MENKLPSNSDSEKPPVFGSWGMFYLIVVLWLVLMIVLFNALTQFYS